MPNLLYSDPPAAADEDDSDDDAPAASSSAIPPWFQSLFPGASFPPAPSPAPTTAVSAPADPGSPPATGTLPEIPYPFQPHPFGLAMDDLPDGAASSWSPSSAPPGDANISPRSPFAPESLTLATLLSARQLNAAAILGDTRLFNPKQFSLATQSLPDGVASQWHLPGEVTMDDIAPSATGTPDDLRGSLSGDISKIPPDENSLRGLASPDDDPPEMGAGPIRPGHLP